MSLSILKYNLMKYLFLFAITILSQNSLATRGGQIGNAGDEIKQFYKKAQKNISDKLADIELCEFHPEAEPEVKNFILENHVKLSNDIKNSLHIWPINSDQTACVSTNPQLNHPLFFQVNTCKNTHNKRSLILEVLLESSLKHLTENQNVDSEFYKKIINEIIRANSAFCTGKESNKQIIRSSQHNIA